MHLLFFPVAVGKALAMALLGTLSITGYTRIYHRCAPRYLVTQKHNCMVVCHHRNLARDSTVTHAIAGTLCTYTGSFSGAFAADAPKSLPCPLVATPHATARLERP